MKRSLAVFLQAVIVLIGIGVLIFMLWEPHLEGRNVNATTSQIYFNDPFLAYTYTVSIAFFVALYWAFRALGYVRENRTFSQATAKALRIIKYCTIAIVAFTVAPVAYLFIARPGDDIAGGVAMGLFIILVSAITATTAGMFERRVQKTLKHQQSKPF